MLCRYAVSKVVFFIILDFTDDLSRVFGGYRPSRGAQVGGRFPQPQGKD